MFRLYFKRWMFILVVTVVCLVVGIRTSILFFNFFFWFLMSAIIINFAWIMAAYLGAKLHFKRNILTRINEDEFLEIEVLIENKGLSSLFNIVLQDNLACAFFEEREKRILIEYLKGKSRVNLKYRCSCPQRGKYGIGPFEVYFFDVFGLFYFKRTYRVYSEIYVYPRDFSIRKFPSLVRGFLPWFGIQSTNVSGDEDEFFGVREYKRGDPIRIIHWISTARKNRLIVKQFQRQSFFRASIVFNLEKEKNYGENKETVAEYIVKITASVAKFLIERGIGVSLHGIVHESSVVNIPFNKGPEHLGDIYKFLAIAQAESKVGLSEIFEDFSREIPNDSTAVVIMTESDWESFPPFLLLEKRNIAVIPLIIISSTFLYPFNKEKIVNDVKMKFASIVNIKPIFFAQGDNLEECFLKY